MKKMRNTKFRHLMNGYFSFLHIDKGLVDHFVETGLIYPYSNGEAIFMQTSTSGTPVGFESAGFTGEFSGSIDFADATEYGFFTLPCKNANTIVVVEDALQAMAYATLHPFNDSIVLSLANNYDCYADVVHYAEALNVSNVVVAFKDKVKNQRSALLLIKTLWKSGIYSSYEKPVNANWTQDLCGMKIRPLRGGK